MVCWTKQWLGSSISGELCNMLAFSRFFSVDLRLDLLFARKMCGFGRSECLSIQLLRDKGQLKIELRFSEIPKGHHILTY